MDLFNHIYTISINRIYHDLVYHEPIHLSRSPRSHLAPPDPLRDRLGRHKGRRGVERGQASLEQWENTVDHVWKTMRKYTNIYEHVPSYTMERWRWRWLTCTDSRSHWRSVYSPCFVKQQVILDRTRDRSGPQMFRKIGVLQTSFQMAMFTEYGYESKPWYPSVHPK